MQSLSDIFNAARSLPSEEQVQLIHALWDALPPDQWTAPADEWLAEAASRSDAYDAGDISGAPWSEVRARVRHQVGLDG